jgi:hypothetical protein
MDTKFPKLTIEFTDSGDHRGKTAFCENIESDEPLPVPAVGDVIYITHAEKANLLKVKRRMIHYGDGYTQVQVFCHEVEESDIFGDD